jgi:tetratricopeptide (TPR) repeat protein
MDIDYVRKARAVLSVKSVLRDSFAMDCSVHSLQGVEYCGLAVKPGRARRYGAPAVILRPADQDALDETGRLLASAGSVFASERLGYLARWVADSPQDFYAKSDLIDEAARCVAEAERGALGSPENARDMVGALIKARPQDAALRVKLAQLLQEQGRPHEALAALRRAEALRPRGKLRLLISDLYKSLREPKLGLKALEAMAEEPAADAETLVDLAQLQQESGRNREALESLQRAQARHPDSRQWSRMAGLYQVLRAPEQALRAAGFLVEVRPDDPGPRLQRAQILEEMGRDQEALASLQRAEELHLSDSQRLRIADMFRLLRAPERALKALETLSAGSHRGADVYLERAQILRDLGRRQEAIESLHAAQSSRPDEPSRLEIARLSGSLQVDGATEDPDVASLLLVRAQGLREIGKRAEAMESLQKAQALGLRPEDQRRAAWAYQALGECGKALAIWERLAAAPGASAKDLSDKAVCEYIDGDWQKAVADLRRAIAMSPESLEASLSLGMIYAQKGLVDQAIQVYAQALAVNPAAGKEQLRRQIQDAYDVLARGRMK